MADRICIVPECTNPHLARGFCNKHYQHWATGKDPATPSAKEMTPAQRFWVKVEVADCWEWVGGRDWDGYGIFSAERKSHRAHRWSYEYLVGAIPEGLHLDHLCRNRACVNPDHLEPVTPRENTFRGVTAAVANAAKTHCPEGHSYNRTRLNGDRACSVCAANASRKSMGWSAERIAATPVAMPESARTHCPRGHEYSESNTYRYRGQRKCRSCHRERERERSRQRRRSA